MENSSDLTSGLDKAGYRIGYACRASDEGELRGLCRKRTVRLGFLRGSGLRMDRWRGGLSPRLCKPGQRN